MRIRTLCVLVLICLLIAAENAQAAPVKAQRLCINSAKGTVLVRTKCRRKETGGNLSNLAGLLGISAQPAAPDFYFARVSETGVLLHGSTGVTSVRTGAGYYNVYFPVDIRSCYWLVTKAPNDGGGNDLTSSWTISRSAHYPDNLLQVLSWRNYNQSLNDSAFTLVVMCGA